MSVTLRHIFAVVCILLLAATCYPQSADNKQANFAAHVQAAKQYLDEKRPDLAIPELQAAVAINPDNVETQGNLGVLLYFQGKLAEAIPHLRAAVEKQPGMGKIQGLLGLAELRTVDSSRAQKDLETAFPSIPDQKFKVDVGLELLGLYTRGGDLEAASTMVPQLRKMAPDNPQVLYAAYRTYADLFGESMLALSLVAPDSAQMHQVIAHEQARKGDTKAAIAEFRKALEKDPHLPGAHFELAELLYTSQDEAVKKDAEREYKAELAENPQDEKTIVRLAEIDAQKGNIQQAFKGYTKAAELQPTDADAKLGLAKALVDMNQSDKALALLQEAVQLEPTNATAHYRLGTLYRKLGRADEAKNEIELYKKYKDMKEKLRAVYKDLQAEPNDAEADERHEVRVEKQDVHVNRPEVHVDRPEVHVDKPDE